MLHYTDSPLDDFNAWDAEQNRRLERCPVCCYCGHHIQDEDLFDINGELWHIACAEREFRRDTGDYIE